MRTTKIFLIGLAVTILFVQSGIAFDWAEYSPQGSSSKVQMPKKPTLCVKKGIATESGSIDMYQALADYGDYAFLMTFNDYPNALLQKKTNDQILDDVVKGSIGDGEVISQGEIKLGNFPGRAYTCKKKGLELKAFVYLVGPRLYQLIVAYPPDQAATLKRDRDTFLTSLKLDSSGSQEKPNDALYNCATQ